MTRYQHYTEARALCEELPRMVEAAMRCGLTKTARRLNMAQNEIGFELDRVIREADRVIREAAAEPDIVDWIEKQKEAGDAAA